tara:strand:- start:91 stop:390 length:300 start_codon:yes stop_codon:yes gene_type:complete
MAKLKRKVFIRKKKLDGTIEDYPLVEVSTHDWVSNSEWVSINKARKLEPAKCYSVGRIFNQSKTKIQLFGSWSYDEDGSLEVGTIETIPKSWTITIKQI